MFVLFITVIASSDQKNVDCYQWICFYLQIYIFGYDFQFSLLVVLFFSFFFFFMRMGESMFCAAVLIRKTNFLDFNMNIGS